MNYKRRRLLRQKQNNLNNQPKEATQLKVENKVERKEVKKEIKKK